MNRLFFQQYNLVYIKRYMIQYFKEEPLIKQGHYKFVYNVPYRVDKFKSSFPEIRQVKVPIPSEMDR